uniref:Uncharacterized protein n=1 Tax=Parascaris univalens TaxID=6257 RepID=A0A914ZW91_PARUN
MATRLLNKLLECIRRHTAHHSCDERVRQLRDVLSKKRLVNPNQASEISQSMNRLAADKANATNVARRKEIFLD